MLVPDNLEKRLSIAEIGGSLKELSLRIRDAQIGSDEIFNHTNIVPD